MKIFKGLNKEKNETCCSKEEHHECLKNSKDATIIVLGACCAKSIQTFENVLLAVKELGFDDEVKNIGDHSEIASFGVMSTPALVVDGKVICYGRKLSVEDAKSMIKKARA